MNMKHLFVCIALSLLLTSCDMETLVYRLESERYLKAALVAPSTYKRIDFGKIQDITIKDEIDERVTAFERLLESSEQLYKSYPTDYALKTMNRDRQKLEAVKTLYELYADKLDSVTYYHFRTIYEAKNPMGVPIRGAFETKFHTNGIIVGARMDEDSWTVLGDMISMPEYYDLIKVDGD